MPLFFLRKKYDCVCISLHMHIKIELNGYTKSRAITSAKFDRGRISLNILQVSSLFELLNDHYPKQLKHLSNKEFI